jgi:hypothetical protein
MRRGSALCTALALLAALTAGCGTGKGRPSRGIAAGLLIGLTAVAGGATIYSAKVSDQKQKDLERDVQAGSLTGRQFATRDQEGQRWNRAARASAFVGILGVVGLVIVGEMMLADQNQYGPVEPPAEKPIIPGASPERPAAAAALPLPPRAR